MLEELRRFVQPLADRVKLMVSRAVVRLVDDTPKAQELQVEALAGEVFGRVERFQNYGLTSHPPAQAEAIVVCIGSNRDHPVAIAVEARATRPRNLQAGEVCLYDDLGSRVTLKRGGLLEVEGATEIVLQAGGSSITINAAGITLKGAAIALVQ